MTTMVTMVRMRQRMEVSRSAHELITIRTHTHIHTAVRGWRPWQIALKQVVSTMPTDATEIPQFFENLEAMFRSFEIPADLRAKLLLPFLSLKPKSLISRLHAEELEDHEGDRDFLLSEFKLTPREIAI